eukprot:565449-Rhodomonas_salina.2
MGSRYNESGLGARIPTRVPIASVFVSTASAAEALESVSTGTRVPGYPGYPGSVCSRTQLLGLRDGPVQAATTLACRSDHGEQRGTGAIQLVAATQPQNCIRIS